MGGKPVRTWPVSDPKPGELLMLDPSALQKGESSWKDTNPKEAFGDQKLPLSVVPNTTVEYCSLALLEGALKYGRFNWRVKGVKVATYLSALKRHISKYEEGQWADPKTKVPHLASALACITIILDAGLMGKLTDDRPPSLPAHDEWIDAQSEIVEHLKNMFKDKSPHQYTISDTPQRASVLGGALASNSEETCPSK
jgi:hypothetical protein